ncbi:MAG: hypothetical protein JWQ35_756 [Bacteriovoracaceae bacterium]|nr:hypothetical protein [Bacteriovoracaceae bacterium]
MSSRAYDHVSRKFLQFSIFFSFLALAVVLRMSNQGFVFVPLTGHFNLIDTDCYYYLRRLVHFIANFPHIMVFDPLMDWPTGGTVDWPEGFLLILGVPLKIFGVNSFRSLEIGVSILMIGIGLACCSIIYLASGRVLKDFSIRSFALFFAACNFLLVRFSCLGQIDHHIMEAIFPPLIFYLSLKTFEEKNKISAVLLGLVLTYSLSISSSSIFVITAFFGIYGLILGNRENFKIFSGVILVFLMTLIPYALWSIARRGGPFADNYPSFFHISLVVILALLSFLVAKFRKWSIPILFGFVGFCFLLYLVNWPPVLVFPLSAAFNYVFGKAGVLQNISEAFPIYSSYNGISLSFMHINFGYLIYVIPLAWILNFIPKKLTTAERTLFLMLSVMSVPAIAQKRFSHTMVGLFIIFLVWILNRIVEFIREYDFKFKLPVPVSSSFLFQLLACLLFGILTVEPVFEANFAPNGSPRDTVDLGTSKAFLDKLKMDPQEAWDRLAGKIPPSEGIWVSPNMGHMMMYYTGLGTVDNSFYHPESFDLEFKLRNIESEGDFKKELKEKKIRYIILADDWQFFELQFHLRGLPVSKFLRRDVVQGQNRTMYSMEEFMKLAWSRMLLSEDSQFEGFDRLFSVQFHENHYYNFLRGYKFNY